MLLFTHGALVRLSGLKSLTVSFHFIYSLRFTLLLMVLLSQNARAQEVIRGPYLQGTSTESTTIRWRTDMPTNSKVWYGNLPGSLNNMVSTPDSLIDHEVFISGLDPNTKYFYAIGDDSGMMEGDTLDYYVKTHPITGSKTAFHAWVQADVGTGNEVQRDVRDQYFAMEPNGETPLMITVGDNAYDDGEDDEYQDGFFDIYPTIFRRTTIWAMPGNHDYHATDEDDEEGPYFDIFSNPTAGQSGGVPSGSERYYSFDYANVHFIVVEGYMPEGQMEWLAEDLAQNTQDWTIAMAHHPPFSKGNHDSDNSTSLSNIREQVLPVLEAAGVDLFFSGHSHVYERSFLIHGHYGDSDELEGEMIMDGGDGKIDGDGAYQKTTTGPNANKGTIYNVIGSSGGKSFDGDLDHPIMLEGLEEHGFVFLEVENDQLDFSFINDQGVLKDYFTIIKELPSTDFDNDGFDTTEDCDDTDAAINPFAVEIPNNDVDENCDGIATVIDVDMDGFNSDEDCDDTDAAINPSVVEIPNNGIDENCDGIDGVVDADGDGFFSDVDCDDTDATINEDAIEIVNNDVDENCDGIIAVIDIDQDGFNSDEDCDDFDADINPSETEIPDNGIDENCDGVDQIVLVDLDNDGFFNDVDCDDTDSNINPDAFEIANNDVDENCDGIIIVIDIDNDGFNSDEDCDDFNAEANPDGTEIPNNNVDEDCDGYIAMDQDGDGFYDDVDCDDNDVNSYPGAPEVPNNTIDEDCDGIALIIDVDMDGFNSDEDCDDTDAAINPDATEIVNNNTDEDCDGIAQVIDADMDGFNSDEDCDDADSAVNPDAIEIPNNSIDEDCDGIAQIIDIDLDGFNSDEDCDDEDAAINPDAVEIPNNQIDEDCDGEDMIVGLNSISNDFKLFAYPNPAGDYLMVETDIGSAYDLRVCNVIGEEVFNASLSGNVNKLDLTNVESGLYIIVVTRKDSQLSGMLKFSKM